MIWSQSSPNIDMKVLVAGLLAISVLVGLGLWQLDRAEEKRYLLERKAELTPPVRYLSRSKLEHLSAVQLDGELLKTPLFLLDNRIYKGQVGYEVLALLQQDIDSRAIIVNLGWIAAGSDRRRLPDVAIPTGRLTVFGRLTEINPGLTLKADSWDAGWPKRIQQIDVNKMEQLLNIPLYPWHLRLDKPLNDQFIVDWRVVNMPPEKHQAYAAQWFSMAGALFIWLVWFLKSRSNAEVTHDQ